MTGTEVVNWEEQLRKESKEIAKTERPQVSKISLRSGIMTIGDQPVKDNALECIVVAYIHENMYFKDPYQPDVIVAPTCYSYSRTGEDMVPHHTLPDNNKQSTTCQGCWANEFKSAGNGRKGKACGVGRRKLAVIPAYKEVADVEKAEVAIISLPFMSVKNWSQHVNVLASGGRTPWSVVSRISVKPDQKSQFRVFFDFVSALEQDFLAVIHPKIEMAFNILEQPYDLTPGAYDKKDEEPAKLGKKVKY